MNADLVYEGFVDALRSKYPKAGTLAHYLMDVLSLGKEAVYRRLRGDVPFTLAEAAIISQKMGVSLDNIIDQKSTKSALINLEMLNVDDPIETYAIILEQYGNLMASLDHDPDATFASACNVVPRNIVLQYDTLSKFRIFKWIYQHSASNKRLNFESMEFPREILDKQKELVEKSHHFKTSQYIWDRTIFLNLINDIRYFASINMISDTTLQLLKEEFLEMLVYLEETSAVGRFRHGGEIQVYISDINFEATYTFLEIMNHKLCLIKVFNVNSIVSYDTHLFESLKDWVNSVKKFSTLITQSGEIERINFFRTQRLHLENL